MTFIKNIIVVLFVIPISIDKTFAQIQSRDTVAIANKPSKYSTPKWIPIALSTEADGWFMKSEYISKSHGEIKIWLKIESPSSTIKKKAYKNTVAKWLLIVDCENKRIKILSTVTYSSSGKIIENETDSYPDYEDVVPDSVMEIILERICSQFNK